MRSATAGALLAMALLASGAFDVAAAQSMELTDEQMRQINQLPPVQRQQALDALQQVKTGQDTGVVQPLRESDSNARMSRDLSPVVSNAGLKEPLRADTNSRLVINFSPKQLLSASELADIQSDPLLGRLIGSHAFVLDDAGTLSLQGLEVIPLLGLDEADIERRLGAEPYLAQFDIDARILDSRPTGLELLKPFGYDLFEPHEAGFDPPMTGPVPPDYVLGPGDTVRVQLFGKVNEIYDLDVTRDGILNLPEIGPVTVTGIPFSEFRRDINSRVQQTLIGTQVSVTMGQLRTIRVFVLGDVNRPGSYVVSGLATISSALYRSGGISSAGSLRNVQLKRNGRKVTDLDLYDLLLNGDTSGDRRLQPGDVIFVPPIGATITVGGAVKRPAIYEIKGKSSISDAIQLAGGFASDAFGEGARLERIDSDRERKIVSLDLGEAESGKIDVRAGDVLTIPRVLSDLEDTVVLSGHVQRPGPNEWQPGMRLTDLITSANELKPGADTGYVLVRRERERGLSIQVLSVDLAAAFQDLSGPDNIALEARDRVFVFSLGFGRQRVIAPLLDELRLQTAFDAPFQQVEIAGNVRAPGVYPLEAGMRISDLLRAGGNLAEGAYTLTAELTRYSVVGGESRATENINVDLDEVLHGNEYADVQLEEHDYLRISAVPDWASTYSVRIEGEVRFPGDFRVRQGETLRQVLERAGGLTDEAFPEGAIFLRRSLLEREQEQIELLTRRLEADLASLSLQSVDDKGADRMSTGRVLLEQLRTTKAVGRLVINLERLVSNSDRSAIDDIELKDGDRLLIPTRSQVVTTLGETQQNISHLYSAELSRNDYIDLSGGLTRRADKKLIYVVRASGAVVAAGRTGIFGRGRRVDIHPGDTIVVPLAIDRIRPMTFWTSVTQIMYQGAIAVAAIKTFDN